MHPSGIVKAQLVARSSQDVAFGLGISFPDLAVLFDFAMFTLKRAVLMTRKGGSADESTVVN